MIFLDFDSVLNDLIYKFCDYVKYKYGDDITPSDVTDWDWLPKHYPEIFEIFNHHPYTDEASPFYVQPLWDFNELDFKFTIITATLNAEQEWQKEDWIRKYLGDRDTIHAHNKWDYIKAGDVIIDDKLDTVKRCIIGGSHGIVYDHNGEYGYNKYDGIMRATSLAEVKLHLKNLEYIK
jgi:5'(3')-deoxyribonucleotidase